MCVMDQQKYFLKSRFSVNEMIWSCITKIPLYDPLIRHLKPHQFYRTDRFPLHSFTVLVLHISWWPMWQSMYTDLIHLFIRLIWIQLTWEKINLDDIILHRRRWLTTKWKPGFTSQGQWRRQGGDACPPLPPRGISRLRCSFCLSPVSSPWRRHCLRSL